MSERNKNRRIGITPGDINGVGPELLYKIFQQADFAELATFVLYGQKAMFEPYMSADSQPLVLNSIRELREAKWGKINLVDCGSRPWVISPGSMNVEGAAAAAEALKVAGLHLKAGEIDALVTGPIDKKYMTEVGFPFPGHTEFMGQLCGAEPLMFMIHEDLRVAVATGHMPLQQVSGMLNSNGLLAILKRMNESLVMDFSLTRPRIAVLGLNPHAGDGGKFGKEEQDVIIPAIRAASDSGILAVGPYSADAFFAHGHWQHFDACLAMYHDQGLIPFKAITGFEGVNFTAGLSAIRTSPDHGPAFDLAGQNRASDVSFRSAVYAALDIANSREDYLVMSKSPLKPLSRGMREMMDEGES
jgi:4-hydroxythreonine-4-phosphate dehydrogenase